jgi:hypothetical protein
MCRLILVVAAVFLCVVWSLVVDNKNIHRATIFSRDDSGLLGLPRRNVTLLVELRGELGNHLSVLAHGVAVAAMIEKEYPHLKVIVQGQRQDKVPPKKWKTTADTIARCFPFFRSHNIELHHGGRWQKVQKTRTEPSFLSIERTQDQWLLSHNLTRAALSVDEACEQRGNCWRNATDLLIRMHHEQGRGGNSTLAPEPPYPPDSDPRFYTSLPFLRSNGMSSMDSFVFDHLDRIKEWFAMNESDPFCCDLADVPLATDLVWHYRNFAGESAALKGKGFQDVDPKTAVEALLAPLIDQNHRRVVLVSRFTDNLEPYISALKESNLNLTVAVRRNGTAASDFCFLRRTKLTLVGHYLSTFAHWGATLGEAASVVLYLPNSTHTRRRFVSFPVSFPSHVPDRFHLKVIPYG